MIGSGGATGGGGGGNAGTAGAGDRLGLVAVYQTVQTLPAPIGTIVGGGGAASFGMMAGPNPCQVTPAADCQVYRCPANPPAGTTPALVLAGTITITGLATDVVLTPLQVSYTSPAYTGLLWTSSRQATLTVTGSADVPAYSMSVTAPNPIAVTSPPVQANATYTISRATDLKVTWTGGVEGTVTVGVSSGTAATGRIDISCSAPAAAGTVTVPASALSGLGPSGSFGASVTNTATKSVGGWQMIFQAQSTKDQGTATFTN